MYILEEIKYWHEDCQLYYYITPHLATSLWLEDDKQNSSQIICIKIRLALLTTDSSNAISAPMHDQCFCQYPYITLL